MVALGLLNMLADLFLDQSIAFLNRPWCLDNERFGHFAFAVRWDADDYAIADGRVGKNMCFKLGGCDLQTLDFDESDDLLVLLRT